MKTNIRERKEHFNNQSIMGLKALCCAIFDFGVSHLRLECKGITASFVPTKLLVKSITISKFHFSTSNRDPYPDI
jgi:hypothetical protein